jgi:hypothetical protein
MSEAQTPAPKTRSNAKLKTLPEDRQADISDYARDHSLAETVQWLAANGVETSTSALSLFLSWFNATQQLARNDAVTQEFLDKYEHPAPKISPDRLHQIGHSFFATMALEKQDPKIWYLTQQIACSKEQIDLERQKYHDHIQAKKEAIQKELDTAKSQGGLSPETIEKIEHELNLF